MSHVCRRWGPCFLTDLTSPETRLDFPGGEVGLMQDGILIFDPGVSWLFFVERTELVDIVDARLYEVYLLGGFDLFELK